MDTVNLMLECETSACCVTENVDEIWWFSYNPPNLILHEYQAYNYVKLCKIMDFMMLHVC